MFAKTLMTTSAILGLLASPLAALPATFQLESRTNWHCTYPLVYNITTQTAIYSNPETITGVYVSGPASITAGYTYSKSQEWSGGISAFYQFTKAFGMSISGQYGRAYTKGTSLTASVACPQGVTCGITASALVLRIEGYQTIQLCGSGVSYDKTYPCTNMPPDWCPTTVFNHTIGTSVPFVADLPLVADTSIVSDQDLKAVAYAACTLGNGSPGLDPCPNSLKNLGPETSSPTTG